MVCVMIRAPFARLGLAALLCSVAPAAFAQQPQQPPPQRSRTPTETRQPTPTQPSQQRGASAQQKPAASSTAQQKPATSQQKPAAATTSKPGAAGQGKPGTTAQAPGGGQATLLASFGDWGAYASGQGRAKVCYALSQPKDRQPKDLKRDPAYLFVSFRPADNVRNEVAVVMGF